MTVGRAKEGKAAQIHRLEYGTVVSTLYTIAGKEAGGLRFRGKQLIPSR